MLQTVWVGMNFYMRYIVNVCTLRFQSAILVQFTTQHNRVKTIAHGDNEAITLSKESLFVQL